VVKKMLNAFVDTPAEDFQEIHLEWADTASSHCIFHAELMLAPKIREKNRDGKRSASSAFPQREPTTTKRIVAMKLPAQ
jgi:hypothetical protein